MDLPPDRRSSPGFPSYEETHQSRIVVLNDRLYCLAMRGWGRVMDLMV